jgi:thiol-disulfide isomerase/thioredoxin
MNIKEKIKNYFNKKSKLGIASDVFFVGILIAFLIPQSRLQLGAWVNQIKMVFVSPSVNDTENTTTLKEGDYEMVFQDLEGNNLEVSSLKGKVLFLNIWATWCPPCVAEMPSIQKLYEKYKNNDEIAFLIVSNEKSAPVEKFMKKKGYTFPAYLNKFRMPDAFATNSIPTTFVISKEGKIVVREVGASDWASESMFEIMDKLVNE